MHDDCDLPITHGCALCLEVLEVRTGALLSQARTAGAASDDAASSADSTVASVTNVQVAVLGARKMRSQIAATTDKASIGRPTS